MLVSSSDLENSLIAKLEKIAPIDAEICARTMRSLQASNPDAMQPVARMLARSYDCERGYDIIIRHYRILNEGLYVESQRYHNLQTLNNLIDVVILALVDLKDVSNLI